MSGKAVLAAVLAKLPRGKGASKVVTLLRQKRISIDVTSEHRYPLKDFSPTAQCDIWIEIRGKNSAALIVIENKIDAPPGKDQRRRYATVARKWCSKTKGTALLIWLARKEPHDNIADDNWLRLSYLDLASALRDVWRRHRSAPGSEWLKLYISAITRGVLGIDIDRLQDTPIEPIRAYLGRTSQ